MISFAPGLFLVTILVCIHRSHQAVCDDNEFQCASGECIDSFLVCDGEVNCADSSDETKHVCSKTHVVCQPFAFRCTYGACIDGDKKCDGKKDCADNSDETSVECKTQPTFTSSNNCSYDFFQCENGQCISEWIVCDGKPDCKDESDESDSQCVNFPCPQTVGFQCSYGGCIDKDKQCDGIKDCRDGSDEDPLICSPSSVTPPPPITGAGSCSLPRRPEGGVYHVSGCNEYDSSDICRRVPNTKVAQLIELTYTCDEGFKLSNPNNNKQKCINSEWFPAEPIKCLELCKPLTSSSVIITCTRFDIPVNCSEPVLPSTKAKLKCKPSYRVQNPYIVGSNDIVCTDRGRWSDSIFICIPECGIKTGNVASALISKGQNTSAVEYPWHVGLYQYEEKLNKVELFCGGSIITPYLILSVAHCVYESKRVIEASKVIIAVGKTQRDFSITEPLEQRFNVTKIFVHPDYRGTESNYAFDLALLELERSIVIGRVAMPVCRERIKPWTIIPNDRNGTAVGWGKDEHGNLNDVLQVVMLPYMDQDKCKRQADFIFKKFVTHDKFCAKYIDGAGVQQGDSGGGLVFLKPENKLYYIYGLVSTKPSDSNQFATFTNISSQSDFDFIEDVIRTIKGKHEY